MAMLGGLSFPCQEHSPGARTQAVLCLCGCVIHRLRGCPRCRVWCCSWPKCWLCPLVISAVSCDMWSLRKGVLGNTVSVCFVSLGVCVSLCTCCVCVVTPVGVYGVPDHIWELPVVLRWGLSVRGDGACFTLCTAFGPQGP